MVATYRRQSDPLLARMEQPRNYDIDPLLRAVHILSKRPVAAGIYTVSQIDAELQRLGHEYVDDRKVRYWAQMQPDLPEQLIKMKVARPEDFPDWAQPFLRLNDTTAPMAQENSPAIWSGGDIVTAFVEVAAGVGLLWGGIKLAVRLFGPTPQSDFQNAVIAKRRIGGVSRRSGFLRNDRHRL